MNEEEWIPVRALITDEDIKHMAEDMLKLSKPDLDVQIMLMGRGWGRTNLGCEVFAKFLELKYLTKSET